jgi:hypothetical protein
MPRESVRNDRRSQIAHIAARLMAEDGIEDYALAKRKAARQAGLSETRELPTNGEVEEALRSYREIYHRDEHRDRVRALRGMAVRVMSELAQFNPYLTGSVLNGTAGRYADINIQLFTESAKAVELYLIDRKVPYRTAQVRLYCGSEPLTVPVFTIEDGGIDVELTVLSPRELRGPLRTSLEGKSIDRAKRGAIEQLLAEP